MFSQANNRRLTEVEGDAPMGRLMREHCWIPFARSESLIPGDAPQRVRLLGEDFVAFRGEDGSAGLVDERCPHRGVSLALARVEGCTLRCIFHGWRIDTTGAVVEVPSEGPKSSEFAARARVNRYHTKEAGGLIWVFLGQKHPPLFPDLPFMKSSPESRWITRSVVPCNWVQGLEGALDSSHLGWLHRSWIDGVEPANATKFVATPTYEIEDTAYGARVAAVRSMDEDKAFLRIAEFVAPFTVMNQTDRQVAEGREFACFISVPVDNENHLLFWGIWNDSAPLDDTSSFSLRDYDQNNYATFRGTRDSNWGQSRAAMKEGHFSGFTENLIEEDVVVQVSMGPVTDRTRENLCSTDLAIVRARSQLLKLLDRFEGGQPVDEILSSYAREGRLPAALVVAKGWDWRSESNDENP